MRRRLNWLFPVVFMLALLGSTARGGEAKLLVSPEAVVLGNPEASQQLLVTRLVESAGDPAGGDRTRAVRYDVDDPQVARVTGQGRVLPLREGATSITVRDGLLSARVSVQVRGLDTPATISYRQEIAPILSKAGCNSGGCHGKAEGQNGFKLSVFGLDPVADYSAIVQEGRGRRISLAAPARSLLLRKATAEVPHGGGLKLAANGLWHQRIARWIREGAKLDSISSDAVMRIEVEPAEVLMWPNAAQQLRVTAVDATGARRCVTLEADFRSNADAIAQVDRNGLAKVSEIPGEAAILARYLGHVAICRLVLPQRGVEFRRPAEANFIDQAVWDKLELLGIPPSEPADDATFLRRVYLDAIGALPTAEEARRFLNDKDPEKRAQLIDRLLQRDEYADYWAMRWADILRVDTQRLTPQGAVAITRWLRRQMQENTPYDQFVREILTVQGNTLSESPASFYQVHDDPELLGRSVSQLFLGVRIECAQCHHHPFERWSQRDYYAFAGFFTGVGRKAAPIGGQKIFAQGGQDLKHPRTGETVPTAALGEEPAQLSEQTDRRRLLADWMTSPDNPYFARMIAGRLWAHYLGRGLVEPVDDLRATNPASNAPLLDALANYLVETKYDLKQLTRQILNSRVYQLSSVPNEGNALDEQNFSRAAWKPLPAEVLLDAISQATGVPEEFNGWPTGYRAIQVWDNRMPSYFLRVFGRPQRLTVCACERGVEPSIAQALHLMNSSESVRKIRHRRGLAAHLAQSDRTSEQIIEELYLATLSRFPQEQELALMQQAFGEANEDRRSACEDVLWALLNTKEFVFSH